MWLPEALAPSTPNKRQTPSPPIQYMTKSAASAGQLSLFAAMAEQSAAPIAAPAPQAPAKTAAEPLEAPASARAQEPTAAEPVLSAQKAESKELQATQAAQTPVSDAPAAALVSEDEAAWSGPNGESIAWGSLPRPASPSALLIASRKHDEEIGAALLDSPVNWNLDELDETEPPGGRRAGVNDLTTGASALVNWLLARSIAGESGWGAHNNVDKKTSRQAIAARMLRRGASLWQQTPRGCALAVGVFAQNAGFVAAATQSPQWDLARAMELAIGGAWDERYPANQLAPTVETHDLLTWSVKVGNEPIARALLDASWPADRLDRSGMPALARCNKAELAKLLLDRGADPFVKDRDGRPAMAHVQESVGDTSEREKIATLIANAQIESAKRSGNKDAAMAALRELNRDALFSAAEHAPQSSFLGIARKFKFNVASERDADGLSLVAAATLGGRYSTALNLIEGGAPIGATDKEGVTLAAYWAISKQASTMGATKEEIGSKIRAAGLAAKTDALGFGFAGQVARIWARLAAQGRGQSVDTESIGSVAASVRNLGGCISEVGPDGVCAAERLLEAMGESARKNVHYWKINDFCVAIEPAVEAMSDKGRGALLDTLFSVAATNHGNSESYVTKARELCARLIDMGASCELPESWPTLRKVLAQRQPGFLAAVEKMEIAVSLRAVKAAAAESQQAPTEAAASGARSAMRL
jgi:hypothetical protein